MVALVLGLVLSAQTTAQKSVVLTSREAPVLVQDKSGHSIVEISDRAGFKGLSVYSLSGEAAYLGFDKPDKGLIQLLGPGGKLFADASADGFKFFGSAAQAVAFMGADSADNGALQLKNSAGGILAEAGAIDAKTGFVQVYSRSGKSPFPIPNYIKGSNWEIAFPTRSF